MFDIFNKFILNKLFYKIHGLNVKHLNEMTLDLNDWIKTKNDFQVKGTSMSQLDLH